MLHLTSRSYARHFVSELGIGRLRIDAHPFFEAVPSPTPFGANPLCAVLSNTPSRARQHARESDRRRLKRRCQRIVPTVQRTKE